MNVRVKLLLIGLGALALRLALLPFIQHPGIADSNHYYNLATRLVDGHGFTIDYIWQYNDDYADIVHPDDYWMPLTAVLAAGSMRLLGVGVHAALLPFILIGVALVPLTYAAARAFGVGQGAALFAAAAAGFLPEFVLNSLRTDTTLPNTLFLTAAILLLTEGLRGGRALVFAGSGLCAGLAYLTRSDSALLLPMLLVTLLVYTRFGGACFPAGGRGRRLVYAALIPALAVALALPWALRTLSINGTLSTPTTSNMFFLTDYRDHYVYDRPLTLQTLLAAQTPAQLIGKRLFEMAASLKLMYTTLDIFLPVAVAGGLLLVTVERDRRRLLALAPAFILLGGLFVFYTVLVPFKSQGGSFKKAYLSLIPLLLPLAAYALERAIPDRRLRLGAMGLAIGLLAANAFELVRADARFTALFMDANRRIVEVAQTLPDTNGDDDIILMAQDPFMLRFFGVRSVMIPMEDRETVLRAAARYRVDYLLMPPDRPALDPLYLGRETDSRFVRRAEVEGTPYVFFALETGGAGS